jgi:hypothetical protein
MRTSITVSGWRFEASLAKPAHGGYPEPEAPSPRDRNALKMLDAARHTLDRVEQIVPDLFAMGAPGTPAGAAAVLSGFATSIGREADALLAAGHDAEGERLVFLLSEVLDAFDFLGHIGAA